MNSGRTLSSAEAFAASRVRLKDGVQVSQGDVFTVGLAPA